MTLFLYLCMAGDGLGEGREGRAAFQPGCRMRSRKWDALADGGDGRAEKVPLEPAFPSHTAQHTNSPPWDQQDPEGVRAVRKPEPRRNKMQRTRKMIGLKMHKKGYRKQNVVVNKLKI